MSSERAATDTPPSEAAAASPLSRSSLQDEINSRIYHARGVTNAYRSKLLLDRPETMALLRYQPGFFGRKVLDIGIGTGRTVARLPRKRSGGVLGCARASRVQPGVVGRLRRRSRGPHESRRGGPPRPAPAFARDRPRPASSRCTRNAARAAGGTRPCVLCRYR